MKFEQKPEMKFEQKAGMKFEPKPEAKRPSLVAPVYQAKAVLGNVNSEMKVDEIRKFRFVYQNSGNCPLPSDVKLVQVSGDTLETELNVAQNEVKPGVYFMI